ncbi:MAG: 2-oxoglutarate oxidoreductase [Nitrospinae bacterium]|nr:2-oxoglutarate oxidoreductase [Nitrospinota bacterium]
MVERGQARKVYSRPRALHSTRTHYCPGCGHGVIHRMLCEVIDELGIQETTIGVSPVGCAVFAFNYINVDFTDALHGRAPAVATGIKRSHPDKVVFTYQGDGDLAAIGLGEIVHAASRGEKITTLFVNNANYGMTGGQMAPTTLPGQRTTTSPHGRDPEVCGYPLRMAELLATIEGVNFLTREALDIPARVISAKKAIKTAFAEQLAGKGFNLVEILSPCASGWGMTPLKAREWLREKMIPQFPLGRFK